MGYTGQNGGNDSILISGSNSVLNISYPTAGYIENVYGPNDSLIISNGGSMFLNNLVYLSGTASASNTTMIVTGPGSLLGSSSSLLLGYAGASNRVEFSDGALVTNVATFIGGYGTTAGSNNLVIATGQNTRWTNSDIIYT